MKIEDLRKVCYNKRNLKLKLERKIFWRLHLHLTSCVNIVFIFQPTKSHYLFDFISKISRHIEKKLCISCFSPICFITEIQD